MTAYNKRFIENLCKNVGKESSAVIDTYKEYLLMYTYLISKGYVAEYYKWSAEQKVTAEVKNVG